MNLHKGSKIGNVWWLSSDLYKITTVLSATPGLENVIHCACFICSYNNTDVWMYLQAGLCALVTFKLLPNMCIFPQTLMTSLNIKPCHIKFCISQHQTLPDFTTEGSGLTWSKPSFPKPPIYFLSSSMYWSILLSISFLVHNNRTSGKKTKLNKNTKQNKTKKKKKLL